MKSVSEGQIGMIGHIDLWWRQRRLFALSLIAGCAVLLTGLFTAPTDANAAPYTGEQIHVGVPRGYAGTHLFPVWFDGPGTGAPDSWAYCIEHDVRASTDTPATIGSPQDFLGENYFSDPEIQGKVFWVMANSYPVLSLEAFGEQVGAPGISENDAIEAVTYAIWRYTDVGFDSDWRWETADSETAYKWLVNQAELADTVPPETSSPVSVSLTPPSGNFAAGELVGPFTLHTSEVAAQLTTDAAYALVDAMGVAIDASGAVDGQTFYVDTRGTRATGGVTVTAKATGPAFNRIVSVPKTAAGIPTAESHAQTIALVAPVGESATATAAATWVAAANEQVPEIESLLVDAADGDKVLASQGGRVVDTITFAHLEPGTEYTIAGQLINKADGMPTGIVGSATFTPETADGTVQVAFTVPKTHAGQTLVAFQRLYLGVDTNAAPLAVHEDINDAAQTITVENETAGVGMTGAGTGADKLANTGAGMPVGLAVLGMLGLAAGGMLLFKPRRMRQTTHADEFVTGG